MSARPTNLLEDTLFDLTDPHPCQIVDLADLLKRMWPVLSSDHDAILAFYVRYPVRTPLALAVDASFGCDSKTCCAVDHLVRRFVLLDHGQLLFSLVH